ncbi:MAG: MFS transporter [Planctomycetia bacterium]|nr:MFS transporter [Planctomycetia bacterium]
MTKGKIWFALAVLFAINLMNFYDRLIIGAVGELIRTQEPDWHLSDSDLGYLGTAFILLYAAVGVPLGRWSDRGNRSRILTIGVTVWSMLTALSGMAQSFRQMVVLRLSVGVGEATCAPAANSLIGDLFPAATRARAMSIFMLGLPLGNAACLLFSGTVAKHYGWQTAFYVALIPGLLCALGAAMIHEPKRGATEAHNIGARKRDGSPYRLVLSIPTMRWIIASGALHNFNMYAIGGFLTPFVMRVHHTDVQFAGWVTMAVYGLAGVPGMILGGLWGDAILRRRRNGRMLLAAIAIAVSVPLLYFALGRPAGEWLAFALLFGSGCALLYAYYATVYSTIQDVIEPSLRATAMALYFCAMYAFGGALGPTVIGKSSDYFAHRAAVIDGVNLEGLDKTAELKSLEPYRGEGLNTALYALPVTSLLLALTLFAGARTVTRDAENLQTWMRESSSEPPKAKREKIVT